jgi:hypothetical protein
MKKILKLAAGITLLLAFALLLTGCISIEMKVNKNGSCDIKYEIKTEGMVSLAEVKKQFESGIDETNKAAGKNVAKLKNIKEKDGTITANISISNISYMEDGAFFGKYSEFDKEYPQKLEALVDAKSGKSVEKSKIKGTGGLNAVMLSGMDTGGGELTKFTMILPGSVKYTSSNVSVIDDKTVSLGSGYGVVLYKSGGGAGWLIIVLIIAAVVVVGFVILGKKKKAAPAPAAAPAVPYQAGTPAAPAPAAAPGAGSDRSIFCPHCGAEQKSTAVFCAACGGKISQ